MHLKSFLLYFNSPNPVTIKLLISIPPPKLNITQKEFLFLALALGRAVGKTANGMDTMTDPDGSLHLSPSTCYTLHCSSGIGTGAF